MPTDPVISVIIVTYNRLGQLQECLNALKNQTLDKDKYDVIVVDDGSSDGTKEYLQELNWEDKPRYRYFLEEHQGLVGARNFGAAKSSAKYISFTDDDCIPEPQWLEKVLQTFALSENVAVVGAVTRPVFRNKLFKPINVFTQMPVEQNDPQISYVKGETGLIGLRPFSGCNLHINREIFNRLGKFNVEIQPSEDIDFMYRYLNSGGVAANRMDMRVDHYERDDNKSMFRRWSSFGKNDPSMVRKYLADYFTLEVDLFHGKLDTIFKRFRSIFPVYFQLNLFKLFLLLLLVLFIKPALGLVAMFVLFGALYVSQKNPRATTSFLFYSFFSQASYMYGALKGWKKNKVLFL